MKLFNLQKNKENKKEISKKENDESIKNIEKERKNRLTLKKFFLKEFRNLENFEMNDEAIKNSGSWPLIVKILFVIFLNVSIVLLANQFHFKSLNANYEKETKQELQLKDSVVFKIKQTAGVEEYKNRIDEMKKSFDAQLSQLPSAIEVDALLKDITETAMKNGVEFDKFQMLDEIQSEFYIEVPMELILVGTYHSLGEFISDVSHLDRIVTFHDFELKEKEKEDLLVLKVVAKTYKYKQKK